MKKESKGRPSSGTATAVKKATLSGAKFSRISDENKNNPLPKIHLPYLVEKFEVRASGSGQPYLLNVTQAVLDMIDKNRQVVATYPDGEQNIIEFD